MSEQFTSQIDILKAKLFIFVFQRLPMQGKVIFEAKYHQYHIKFDEAAQKQN